MRPRSGLVRKDAGGGYGWRLLPVSQATRLLCVLGRRRGERPSLALGYAAAQLAAAGHEVVFTRGPAVAADLALVASSVVDYRNEARSADLLRRQGAHVGFVGHAASKLPELFEPHADFVVYGEPEGAVAQLARGERLRGLVASREAEDLDALPFPRWDLLGVTGPRQARRLRGLPVLAGRGCPEACVQCPNGRLRPRRERSVASLVAEIEALRVSYGRAHLLLQDPQLTRGRSRALELAEALIRRGGGLTFECEARLADLDPELLGRLAAAGLTGLGFAFGGEAEAQAARALVFQCARLGISTQADVVLGLPGDDRDAVTSRIEATLALAPTLARFRVPAPLPGSPLARALADRVFETDRERFDGFSVTFHPARLSAGELQFLLQAAYTRFYLRPSLLLRGAGTGVVAGGGWLDSVLGRLDAAVGRWHAQRERTALSRAAL